MNSTDKILKRLTELHPKIIDLSLERVFGLLKKLENPHLSIPPPIHIAGTNGKGSTLAFLKAGIESNNKLVHAYSSPHLVDFNERIILKGKKIDEKLLIDYLKACELANEENNITFFEITTCAAFLAFRDFSADYTLLEVGLGGRLDATNVISAPALSIITPISLDHQQFLGETIEEIATEKAGIFKPNIPAIIGKQTNQVQKKICSIAETVGTPIFLFGRDWISRKFNDLMVFEDNEGSIELPAPQLRGTHQYENAGIAIAALKALGIKGKSLSQSVLTANWPGRLQKLKSGPLLNKLEYYPFQTEVWIDGGHNPAAANALATFLKEPFAGENHVILGMINSKDVKNFVSAMSNLITSICCVSIPNETASLDEKSIFFTVRTVHINVFKEKSLTDAMKGILKRNTNHKNIRVIICGSLYLCGYVLRDHS